MAYFPIILMGKVQNPRSWISLCMWVMAFMIFSICTMLKFWKNDNSNSVWKLCVSICQKLQRSIHIIVSHCLKITKQTLCRQILQPWPEKINIKLFTHLTNVIFGDSGESKKKKLKAKGETKSHLRSERLSSRSKQKKWNAGEESATSLTGVPKSSRENSTIKKTIMHEKSQAGSNCFSLYLLKIST